MMDDFLIKPEHVRNTEGYCMAGVNDFCRYHGICFKTFIRQGIPAQVLIDTGDALAIALVEQAANYEQQKAQEASGGQ